MYACERTPNLQVRLRFYRLVSSLFFVISVFSWLRKRRMFSRNINRITTYNGTNRTSSDNTVALAFAWRWRNINSVSMYILARGNTCLFSKLGGVPCLKWVEAASRVGLPRYHRYRVRAQTSGEQPRGRMTTHATLPLC